MKNEEWKMKRDREKVGNVIMWECGNEIICWFGKGEKWKVKNGEWKMKSDREKVGNVVMW